MIVWLKVKYKLMKVNTNNLLFCFQKLTTYIGNLVVINGWEKNISCSQPPKSCKQKV
jgi:hypothetical protein